MSEQPNELRREMVANAAQRCANLRIAPTLAKLASFLPKDFALDARDLAELQSADIPETMGADVPSMVEEVAPVVEPVVEDVLTPGTGSEDEMDPEADRERLRTLQTKLGEWRSHRNALDSMVRKCRGDLASAVSSWQTGLPRITPAQLIRDHINAAVQQRAAALGAPPAAPEPCADSVIDRSAKWGLDASAEGHVRKNMVTGFRRGAYPGSYKGRKLPSQR